METTVDSVGRIVIPKPMRDALGLVAGARVDVSLYGNGLTIVPGGRTARLIVQDGQLVATGNTVVTDEVMYRLIDEGRR